MATRRSVLRCAAGAAVAAPLAGALVYLGGSADADDGAPVPATLYKPRSGPGTGTLTPEADFPLTHLALSFAGAAAVRVRTAAGWGDWREAGGCAAGAEQKTRRSAVLPVAGASGFEIQTTGGEDPAVIELNTVDGPTRAIAPPPSTLPLSGAAPNTRRSAGRLRRPLYLSRRCWGADEAYRLNPDGTLDTPPTFFPVQTLTVHHTGFDDDQPDPAATIRAIYFNQAVTLDWGDVGGFNAGNVGVCLIGDFTARQPSAAARRSLTAVLAILSAVCRLDPTGTTNYVNPVNARLATLPTIAGHREWNTANPLADPTECPGNTFYPTLPAVRTEVGRLLHDIGIRP